MPSPTTAHRTRPRPGRERILALVQAGGQGSRMDVLTRERAKPALPFGGSYQLIDFALSSLANAGIADVWVGVQFLASSLDPHLASGRPWDLDRTRGGFRRVVPEEGGGSVERTGFSKGNADNLLRLRDDIGSFDPDVLLVLSADSIFNVDLRSVIDLHLDRGADCTLVTAQVSKAEAAHKGVVVTGKNGKVRDFAYKPDNPKSGEALTEIIAYEPSTLLRTLDELHVELTGGARMSDGAIKVFDEHDDPDDDNGLGDFGDHLLPRLVRDGAVYAVDIGGYWKDVGRPEAYLEAHRDLLAGKVDVFDDAQRPVLTRFPELPPARVSRDGTVNDSLLSPGCVIEGTVRRSVLGPGVHVRKGAVIEDSVVGRNVVVEGGASVRTAIIDADVVVGARSTTGGGVRGRPSDDQITLVGKGSRIRRNVTVERGARLEPGSTA